MPVRTGSAIWEGNLRDGKGVVHLGKKRFSSSYSFHSRFEEDFGSNPEELLAASHAACFSMAFANLLAQSGYSVFTVKTVAEVHLGVIEGKANIGMINLKCKVSADEIEESKFQELAELAKKGCPISRVLDWNKVEIKLSATLV